MSIIATYITTLQFIGAAVAVYAGAMTLVHLPYIIAMCVPARKV